MAKKGYFLIRNQEVGGSTPLSGIVKSRTCDQKRKCCHGLVAL